MVSSERHLKTILERVHVFGGVPAAARRVCRSPDLRFVAGHSLVSLAVGVLFSTRLGIASPASGG